MLNITVTLQASPELLQAIQGLSAAISPALQAQNQPATQPDAQVQTVPTAPQVAAPIPTVPVAPSVTPVPQAAIAPAPAPAAVPTKEQTYTLDQLAVAATQLVDAGRQPDVVALLQQFGVQALTQLPKEQYGAFATALRQMGAKI